VEEEEMKWNYDLEPGGGQSLEISTGNFGWKKKTEVRLNGNLIGTFPNQLALAEGQVLQLPDGTALRIQRVNNKLRVLRNDKRLPSISSEVHSTIYFIGGLSIVLGLITLIFQAEFPQTLGFGVFSIAIGSMFLVLGFLTQRRSLIALIIAMIIFGLEGAAVLLSGFKMLLSAFNAANSLHMIGEILQNEALLVGGLVGWTGIYISWLILMVKGVREISEVKKEMPSNFPAINTILSRGLAFAVLVGFIILSAGIYYIYVPQIYHIIMSQVQTKAVIDGPSIEERNAAAGAAVTYESGAGFVEALERAGFACTNPTISAFTASGAGETFRVADNVACDYGTSDVVKAFVAWPSEISSTYFSMYFKSHQEAPTNTFLKGELWFAWASDDQGLFDIQDALGGQLVRPAPAPSEDETVLVQSTPAPNEGEISQFATGATASSQYTETSWSAMQATSAPDTAGCGDLSSAWASLNSSGKEWLLLTYGQPVIPTHIVIYQTYNPGAVFLVEVLDEAGNSITVYETDPTTVSECPYMLEIDVKDVNTLVRSVRVTIDQSFHNDWTEIDAVQLIGKTR
jgi:hypothetical protein